MAKASAVSRQVYKFQYEVKFICTSNMLGTSQTTDRFFPGTYQKAVNIHNPKKILVKMRKKIASLIEISKYFPGSLNPDAVERVTCTQITDFDLHLIYGFEEFLVIESTHNLGVVAVYTSGGNHLGRL